METDNKHAPVKAPEHGAVRKYDQIGVTEEKDEAAHDKYFNADGIKVTDVEFVGVRAPDADPDDGVRERDRDNR
jgi:hypothetical protein